MANEIPKEIRGAFNKEVFWDSEGFSHPTTKIDAHSVDIWNADEKNYFSITKACPYNRTTKEREKTIYVFSDFTKCLFIMPENSGISGQSILVIGIEKNGIMEKTIVHGFVSGDVFHKN